MWVADVLTTTDTMGRTDVGEGELVAPGRQGPSSTGRGGRHDGHGGRGKESPSDRGGEDGIAGVEEGEP